VIRQQMEAQRASLAEKLETLEDKIVRTVDGAREAVAETVQTVKDSVQSSVETVKDTVQSSVETVKETFDVRHQVERHPWAMFGGSVALGFAAGWLLNRATGTSGASRTGVSSAWGYAPAAYTGAGTGVGASSRSGYRDDARSAAAFTGTPTSSSAAAQPKGPSWVEELSQTFAPEVQKLKGLAIGAAMGIVRDLVTQSVPDQLRGQVDEMLNNVTTKLGGQPVQGHLLDDFLPQRHGEHTNGHQGTPQGAMQGGASQS